MVNEARTRLMRLGYQNVTVIQGDATLGCPEHAPFDAIARPGPDLPETYPFGL